MPNWTENDIPGQAGKIAIVTGANSGIGYETARALAAKGATVILAGRNEERVSKAAQQIRDEYPNVAVDWLHLDLADLSSIRKFAEEFTSRYDQWDYAPTDGRLENADRILATLVDMRIPLSLDETDCDTILAVLVAGFAFCLFRGLLDFGGFEFAIAPPQWVAPEFSPAALIGVGIPLYVVTMVSQNIPGIAVLRTAGYHAPISSVISWTGLTTLLLAPFGGFAYNLAAITAAICTGPEAHTDAEKRYVAGLATGVFYLLLGLGGGAIAALFAAFPVEFILALAGLALLSTIANSLYTALQDGAARESAIITFVVTASGLSLFGIGAAFWGLVAGVGATLVFNYKKQTA